MSKTENFNKQNSINKYSPTRNHSHTDTMSALFGLDVWPGCDIVEIKNMIKELFPSKRRGNCIPTKEICFPFANLISICSFGIAATTHESCHRQRPHGMAQWNWFSSEGYRDREREREINNYVATRFMRSMKIPSITVNFTQKLNSPFFSIFQFLVAHKLSIHFSFVLFLSRFTAGKEGISTVAVKTLKENATEIERNDLYSELHVS